MKKALSRLVCILTILAVAGGLAAGGTCYVSRTADTRSTIEIETEGGE